LYISIKMKKLRYTNPTSSCALEAYVPPPLLTLIMILWKGREHLMIWNLYWTPLKHRLTHKCKNKYSHSWQTKTIQENHVQTVHVITKVQFTIKTDKATSVEKKITIRLKMSDLQTRCIRRVWRNQRGNHNPYISKKNRQHNGQKKKVQKDKQRSTKTYR
jgi:hypothetical protein